MKKVYVLIGNYGIKLLCDALHKLTVLNYAEYRGAEVVKAFDMRGDAQPVYHIGHKDLHIAAIRKHCPA